MAIPIEKRRFTREEYFEQEERALEKHEFHDGEILAMSGGTYEHSLITANLVGEIRNRLKGTSCRVLESNLSVRATATSYLYPDATIVCGEPSFDAADAKRRTILNPRVIIETLSPSTEAYDRGAKFALYRQIETLEEYVLLSQTEARVETFWRREDASWLFRAWDGRQAVARFHSVGVDLPLSEVYVGVNFEDPLSPQREPQAETT